MTNLPLRCLLLAAGYGSRLRPLTLKIPKCLVNVGGKPLLDHWLSKLDGLSCEHAFVNTHYLSSQVDEFIESRHNSRMKTTILYEPDLLGTAKTLFQSRKSFEFSTTLVAHADNATSDNLQELYQAHLSRPSHCIMTMMTFHTETPESCGIVEKDSNNVVVGFHEKSLTYHGNCANSAIYILDPAFWKYMDSLGSAYVDFSTDVIPLLVGKIYAVHTSKPFFDIGTPQNLKKALSLWPNSSSILYNV